MDYEIHEVQIWQGLIMLSRVRIAQIMNFTRQILAEMGKSIFLIRNKISGKWIMKFTKSRFDRGFDNAFTVRIAQIMNFTRRF